VKALNKHQTLNPRNNEVATGLALDLRNFTRALSFKLAPFSIHSETPEIY